MERRFASTPHQGSGCTTTASLPAMNTLAPSGVMAMGNGRLLLPIPGNAKRAQTLI
jgi:hypothetical protein